MTEVIEVIEEIEEIEKEDQELLMKTIKTWTMKDLRLPKKAARRTITEEIEVDTEAEEEVEMVKEVDIEEKMVKEETSEDKEEKEGIEATEEIEVIIEVLEETMIQAKKPTMLQLMMPSRTSQRPLLKSTEMLLNEKQL